MRGLYIHIPFCLSKCPYCDFYSERWTVPRAKEYSEAVIRELSSRTETFDTVYFGGGTPILLSKFFPDMMSAIRIADGAEVTAEANPPCCLPNTLETLKKSGVDRVSIGVQSMSADELGFLGRRHTPEQNVSAVNAAYEAGFRNISADIMLGLPDQTELSVTRTIEALSELPVTHVSVYMLKIEENTPFAKKTLSLPSDDETAKLYLHAARMLEKRGYAQYEISNFAKSGFECRHNLKYWRCEEYLGIGAAAHSYIDGKRFCVPRDIEAFVSGDHETVVTDENAGGFDEFAMLRLRLAEGLSFADAERFGVTRETILKRCKAIPPDHIKISETGIALTRDGFLVSNAVIGKILGY